MSYYLLEETMRPCAAEDLRDRVNRQYVAVLTTPEWERERERFDMGIELEGYSGGEPYIDLNVLNKDKSLEDLIVK